MKKISLIAVLLTLVSSSSVFAKDEVGKSIDTKLKSCSYNANNTLESVDCYTDAGKAWDKELSKQYSLLNKGQSEDFQISLKKSQKDWLAYKDSYINAMATFYKQQEGTIWNIIMSEAKIRVTRGRAIELYTLRNSTNMED